MKARTMLTLSYPAVISGALVCAGFPVQAQRIDISKANRSIAVTATAEAKQLADLATVHVGYLEYGPDEKSVYAAGSKTSNAIIDALTRSGVQKNSIQSQNQNISPVNQFSGGDWTAEEKAQRKFQVEQSWTVKCAAKDAASVLDTAVKAGANQSGQIDWSVSDENALEAKAAALALERAKQIAEQMADNLHITLGQLLYASNQQPQRPVMPMAPGAAMSRLEKAEPKPLSISPRQISQFATVYAVFAIE